MEATNLILHIPHASRKIPADAREALKLDDSALDQEVLRMTDHHTDVLFTSACPGAAAIVFPVSRLVVDPERFEDDSDEPMYALGMGVIYERTSDGRVLRSTPTPAEKRSLLDRWYRPHHRRLTEAVEGARAKSGVALVIDCHSFPRTALPYEDSLKRRPEICIGTDSFHTPAALVEVATEWARKEGIDAGVDTPFSGALVPSTCYQRYRNVLGLMLEIRRDLYMDEATGEPIERFDDLSSKLGRLISELSECAKRVPQACTK